MLERSRKFLFIFFILITNSLFASYPEVTGSNSDILYKQLISDIKENSIRIKNNSNTLPLLFYTYKTKESDSIFSVASRFNIPYDTIATLNNIKNQLFFRNHKTILIPTCEGIFSKEDRNKKGDIVIEVNGEMVTFCPGHKFDGKERLNFLLSPFKSPLKNMKITSEFGYRANPFTGLSEFHPGIDLHARTGTNIYSPYDGVINNIGYSEFYGNYLVIEHIDGYSSYFYHLDSIKVNVGKVVKQGDLVALTGNSGKSTGPHLHFEIRFDEEPINPRMLLGDV